MLNLNLKQKQSKGDSVIKLIPGLAISTKPIQSEKVKVSPSIKTIETEDDFNDKMVLSIRRIPISDIKSTTSDLKRKMTEDEKKLLSVSNVERDSTCEISSSTEPEPQKEQEQEVQPEISTLFKKKKTK